MGRAPHLCEWPASFALARAYVDQLARSQGLSADRLLEVRQALGRAEESSGTERHRALSTLAESLQNDAVGSSDADKVRMLVGAVSDLAEAS